MNDTETFPGNLEYAISGLINTLVNKMIQAEDSDNVEEFQTMMAEAGFPGGVTDVNIRNYANNQADEIWGPYKQLPQASTFDGPIEAIRGAKNRITNSGVTELSDAENFSMNALIPGYMKSFETNQTGWRGATISAVRSDYINRWGGMTFLQSNTLAMLQVLLEGYKEQIVKAQQDVVNLVNTAEGVIASFDPGSLCGGAEAREGEFNIAIGVFGIVSAAAGVASAGTLSIATAVAAGVLGWAKDEYKYEKKTNKYNIGGDSVTSVWKSILTSSEELRKEFESSETQLADIASKFHTGISTGKATTGKDAYGGKVEVETIKLLKSDKIPSTGSVDKPLNGSDNPDPAHQPDLTPN